MGPYGRGHRALTHKDLFPEKGVGVCSVSGLPTKYVANGSTWTAREPSGRFGEPLMWCGWVGKSGELGNGEVFPT